MPLRGPLSTPVAFFIFNRPDATRRVFECIAAAQPRQLLVIADGPRPHHPGDGQLCAETRAIIQRVDWECEVLTNYADGNLGCRNRVSSGLDWVFEIVESAIVLEDDCLPDPSFFQYCEELLERYRKDERVAMISGDNFQPTGREYDYSYYYSQCVHVWGWATWRRAWIHYDASMSLWPAARSAGLLDHVLGNRRIARTWCRRFDAVYEGRIDTWDYQWVFACWMRHALTVLPGVNLVSNIGFGADATHTVVDGPLAERDTQSIRFPMRHPPFMVRDTVADRYTDRHVFGESPLTRLSRAVAVRAGRIFRAAARRSRRGSSGSDLTARGDRVAEEQST